MLSSVFSDSLCLFFYLLYHYKGLDNKIFKLKYFSCLKYFHNPSLGNLTSATITFVTMKKLSQSDGKSYLVSVRVKTTSQVPYLTPSLMVSLFGVKPYASCFLVNTAVWLPRKLYY